MCVPFEGGIALKKIMTTLPTFMPVGRSTPESSARSRTLSLRLLGLEIPSRSQSLPHCLNASTTHPALARPEIWCIGASDYEIPLQPREM